MGSHLNRRRVLRGMLGGGAVTVGLPLLDCFLNGNATAMANGAALPVRYGTWFWGLGMNTAIFTPKKTGKDYDLQEETQALSKVKQHINMFSNYRVLTDGRPNLCHFTGYVGLRCGQAPAGRADLTKPSIDVIVSDAIGATTRFSSLQLAATGSQRDSYSFRSGDAVNTPEVSAVAFYTKVFGPEFQDPNSPNFTPDARIMARKSVLSAIGDQRTEMKWTLGASDQARLDEYFTSLREVEQRLGLMLERPPRAEACSVPKAVEKDVPVGIDFEVVRDRHKMMTDILVWAIACNQTKVFNMLYSNSGSNITKAGHELTHHLTTHEEAIDKDLGYQPTSSWFTRRAMESWAYFVESMANIKEGDGTLLDHSLVFAHSDQELAKIHAIDGIPMMTAGTGGGKLKTGYHIDGKGEAGTRVGLTTMRAMGLPVSEWGEGSMKARDAVSEVLV